MLLWFASNGVLEFYTVGLGLFGHLSQIIQAG